jgi:hypothetical protein
MQITKLEPPINGGTLLSGIAVSTRGRRYDFCASLDGKVEFAFREDTMADAAKCHLHTTKQIAGKQNQIANQKGLEDVGTDHRD